MAADITKDNTRRPSAQLLTWITATRAVRCSHALPAVHRARKYTGPKDVIARHGSHGQLHRPRTFGGMNGFAGIQLEVPPVRLDERNGKQLLQIAALASPDVGPAFGDTLVVPHLQASCTSCAHAKQLVPEPTCVGEATDTHRHTHRYTDTQPQAQEGTGTQAAHSHVHFRFAPAGVCLTEAHDQRVPSCHLHVNQNVGFEQQLAACRIVLHSPPCNHAGGKRAPVDTWRGIQ